jgi:hypothetical protein
VFCFVLFCFVLFCFVLFVLFCHLNHITIITRGEGTSDILRHFYTENLPRCGFKECLLTEAILEAFVAGEAVVAFLAPVDQEFVRMIKAYAAFHAEPVFVLLCELLFFSPCLLKCLETAIVALAKLGVGLMNSVMKPDCRRQSGGGGLCKLKIGRSSHLKVLSVGRIYHIVIGEKAFQFFQMSYGMCVS